MSKKEKEITEAVQQAVSNVLDIPNVKSISAFAIVEIDGERIMTPMCVWSEPKEQRPIRQLTDFLLQHFLANRKVPIPTNPGNETRH